MAPYVLSRYTHVLPLPNGKLALRVSCPTCGFVHAGLDDGGESVCSGCHQMLRVRGDLILTSVSPAEPPGDDGREPTGDPPDHPRFWYGEFD